MSESVQHAMPSPNRNASCPCGSGKRYKQCCGAPAAEPPRDRARALMQAALALQQRDALPDAERLYRYALALDPDAFDALHMVGAICYRTGRLKEGYDLIREALERTDWRVPMIRHNFALVMSAMLQSDDVIETLLAGDGELSARIDADSRRFAQALGIAYSGPSTPAVGGNPHRTRANVLIVDDAVPAPDRDAASCRLVAIIGILHGLGCSVTFVSRSVEFGGPAVDALRALGVEVLCQPDAWSIPQVLAARGREIDLVWVCRYFVAAECAAAIRRCAPDALFVLDTVDLHFLREGRGAEITGDPEEQRRAAVIREGELAMIRSADITLVVSDAERDMLLALVPAADVRVISVVMTPGSVGPGFAQRRDMLFVGGFRHRPNVDAVQWYAEEIWPEVRRLLPEARTYVIGSDMPASVRNGIEAVGHVPDLEPYLRRCRLSIAPLRYGAGVKGKISTAQSAGLPVVATTIAIEGMHLTPGRDVLVADFAQAFADAIVRLHEDEPLWHRLVSGGLENVTRYFSADVARPALDGLIDAATARRRGRAAPSH